MKESEMLHIFMVCRKYEIVACAVYSIPLWFPLTWYLAQDYNAQILSKSIGVSIQNDDAIDVETDVIGPFHRVNGMVIISLRRFYLLWRYTK